MKLTILRKRFTVKSEMVTSDYSSIGNNSFKQKAHYFMFEKRPVWYMQQLTEEDTVVHLFLDENLRGREENDYLTRMMNNPENRDMEKYHKKRNKFGTIALLNLPEINNSIHVYQTYKSRMYIETLFDSMKNTLHADTTYMQNQSTLEGWMFVNHICLQWYQTLYIELKQNNLIEKYSVSDYIHLLNDIKKVNINGQWMDSEYTKATAKMAKSLGLKV